MLCFGETSAADLMEQYREYIRYRIPHIQQTDQWDCGLACVEMVLRGLLVNTTKQDLIKECAVESIWTIDLAFLLGRYVQDFTYYTSYLGSRKEYQDDSFYQEQFDADELRVNRLFAKAKSASIHVVRMMLPLDDFKRFLFCKKFAMITLVNARLLHCPICKHHESCMAIACTQMESLLDKVKRHSYIGHFIVLIGYDPGEDMFIYRDPNADDSICAISSKQFEIARKAPGTDHDCLVIQLDQ
ncbi:Guanylyl cyclase [Gongronella butleri]|nr:Guanylyl cyclase [Gongronella butleri]